MTQPTTALPGFGAALLIPLGRIVLASLYILGGLNKIVDPGPTIAAMGEVGLPVPALLVFAVIGVELGFGLVVATGGALAGGRWVPAAALLLVVHTIAINLMIHDFWTDGDATVLSLFFKNVAVAGGLTLVAGLYARWAQDLGR
ncbi:MAG: DoxX family protein [Pseudomonadota bacterium]